MQIVGSPQLRERASQDLVVGGLAATRLADQHHAVPHELGLCKSMQSVGDEHMR